MAKSNGHDVPETSARREPDSTLFTIGGQEIWVPPFSLWSLELCKDDILAIGPGMDWIAYALTVIRVVARVLTIEESDKFEATYDRLRKSCSIPEMRNLSTSLDQLYINSGFVQPGEAEAATEASPGTGMSTDSPQTSQSEESAEETPSKSNVH